MTAVATEMKSRPQETLARMSPEMYRTAYLRGMSLSAWLEKEDPSIGYNDGLDAFSRLMRAAGIQARTIPEMGVQADKFEAFESTEQTRTLVHEWVSRQWRRAVTGKDVSTRALYTSQDSAGGGAMFPTALADAPRYQQITPAIPLGELVAINTGIDSASYDAFYLTDSTDAVRMKRVVEGTDIPTSKLTGGEHSIKLKKFGRGLEQSYEFMRRMRVDLVALHIARMAVQAESDKVTAVLDVVINGDGNSNAPTAYNLTDLDPDATAGALTLAGWLAFKMKFINPYMATTALAREAVALQAMLLNTGSANIPLVAIAGVSGFGSFRPINRGLADGVALGWTADAPANKIVALDARLAVERVYEIGGNITEIVRFAKNQTQDIFMTEVEGYAMFDANAVKVLDISQ